jgi:carboxymethylenebutenolidase
MTKERLIELWEEHIADEFAIKDAQATIGTMCADAYVNHVPTLAGGYGMLPGVAPTYRKVQIPLVAIVGFRDDKLVHEHIYWDQASVLKQIGLLNDPALPVFGAETAEKVLDPKLRIGAALQAKEELV